MKIKVEMDLTPEEMLELFRGNTESLQHAMLGLFMQAVPRAGTDDSGVVAFWQSMAEQSQKMYDEYQKSFTGSK